VAFFACPGEIFANIWSAQSNFREHVASEVASGAMRSAQSVPATGKYLFLICRHLPARLRLPRAARCKKDEELYSHEGS
jgi:hypothetical protein